jgi:hypothetical protein
MRPEDLDMAVLDHHREGRRVDLQSFGAGSDGLRGEGVEGKDVGEGLVEFVD